MAPLPVIANTFRIGLAWSAFQGVTPYNVFHIRTLSEDLGEIRDAVQDAYIEATSDMFGPMATGQLCSFLDITPLDGVTATQTLPLATPFVGANTGQTIPAVCCTVSLKTPQRGAQGRGRLYLGPVTEAAVENGHVLGADDVNAAWDAFSAELQVASTSCVLSVASYTHAEAYDVTSIVVREACSTQRRRQRQIQNA